MNLTAFFNITTYRSDKAYVREAYEDVSAALFHLKNMGHMIFKLFEVSDITLHVQGPAKEIEPLKEYCQTLISMKQYLDSDLDCIY